MAPTEQRDEGDPNYDEAWDLDELFDDEESEPEPGDFWFEDDTDDD